MFVILFGAVLFGLPTLLFKQFQSPDAVVPRLLRAFAGGVILALALVHIIPEVCRPSTTVRFKVVLQYTVTEEKRYLPHDCANLDL